MSSLFQMVRRLTVKSENGQKNLLSSGLGWILGVPLFLILVLPGFALVLSAGLSRVWAAFLDPAFLEAAALSLTSSMLALVLILLSGTPLAWWLARSPSGLSRGIEMILDLPIILPPAVVGIGLLQAFGRSGIMGELLAAVGLNLPFSFMAVVMAQVVIAAPFYLRSATVAFRNADRDLEDVAKTLGHSPVQIFFRVVLPLCRRGLMAGALLAWARALGEFGATLLFAGNMPGVTQTLPLAIFSTLERDVHLAIAMSLLLLALALLLLALLRRFEKDPAGGNR